MEIGNNDIKYHMKLGSDRKAQNLGFMIDGTLNTANSGYFLDHKGADINILYC